MVDQGCSHYRKTIPNWSNRRPPQEACRDRPQPGCHHRQLSGRQRQWRLRRVTMEHQSHPSYRHRQAPLRRSMLLRSCCTAREENRAAQSQGPPPQPDKGRHKPVAARLSPREAESGQRWQKRPKQAEAGPGWQRQAQGGREGPGWQRQAQGGNRKAQVAEIRQG